MKLKTAPRVILGLLLVGGAIYVVNMWMDKRAAAKPPQAEQLSQQPAPAVQQEVVQPAQAAVQPQPAQAAQPAPAPQPAAPATRHDAGLNALIKGGSK